MLFALATSHKIGLACVGVAFILFSLVSSFVLPRRNPNFPGRGLRWYLALCLAFFAAMISAVIVLAKEKKVAEGGGAEAATPAAPAPAATGDPAAGKALFTSQGCGACHTFAPAGSPGKVGPDLDKLPAFAQTAGKPLADFVHESIVDPAAYIEKGYPAGVMPGSYGKDLTPKQIADLVAFLTQTH